MMTSDKTSTVNLDQAARFIKHLTGSEGTPVTFQTFCDNKQVRTGGGNLIKILHGTITERGGELTRLNRQGAGIFITVNETDLKGRKEENITKVRALFLDFDDPSANPRKIIAGLKLPPHMVIESSPGKFHVYWLTSNCELSQFSSLQHKLAKTFGGDIKIKDISRVMRLPGFLHQKGEPFLTRIVTTHDAPPYTVAEITTSLLVDGDALDTPEDKSRQTSTSTPVSRPKSVSGTSVAV